MLVRVLSFGSNWWQRSRHIWEPSRWAIYNSTGVRCGNKVRRHWIVPGVLRLNGVSNFDPTRPMRVVGQTFLASDLTYACGGNRLLLRSLAANISAPDFFLVTITSGFHGRIDYSSPVWKSIFSKVVAISQLRDIQESLLLMRAADWIQTSLGFWQLHVPSADHQTARLICLPPATFRREEHKEHS